MSAANFQTATGRLLEGLDKLKISWHETRQLWTDEQARLFEEEYLQKIIDEVTQALPAIQQVSQTFGTAQRELGE